MATVAEAKALIGTICWRCHYALNADKPPVCCWADHLEPRSDWNAEETTNLTRSGGTSYCVHECPQFLSDKDWEEQQKEEEGKK